MEQLGNILGKTRTASSLADPFPDNECWCNGAGFRVSYELRKGFLTPVQHYCSCEAGGEARAKHTSETAARAIADAIDAAPSRMIAADVPARYRSYTLDKSPLKGASAKVPIRMLQAKAPESWYLHGSYGVGKTGLAVSYLRHFITSPALFSQVSTGKANEQLAIFRTTPDLLSQLRDCYNGNASEYALISTFGDIPLLALDDIGAEHIKSSDWIASRMYQILNRRNGNGLPTVFTSNLTLDELAERIGERVVDRIFEMCSPARITEIKGENLRQNTCK